jgi:hypothetical protein
MLHNDFIFTLPLIYLAASPFPRPVDMSVAHFTISCQISGGKRLDTLPTFGIQVCLPEVKVMHWRCALTFGCFCGVDYRLPAFLDLRQPLYRTDYPSGLRGESLPKIH